MRLSYKKPAKEVRTSCNFKLLEATLYLNSHPISRTNKQVVLFSMKANKSKQQFEREWVIPVCQRRKLSSCICDFLMFSTKSWRIGQ